MSRTAFGLPDDFHAYLLDVSLRETPVQRALRDATAALPNAGMQSSPDQVQFMQMLVRLTGAKRCLEIGVFTGYSALGVAMALPPDGYLLACDVSEEYTSFAKPYWEDAGVDAKIDLRLAPAQQTLDALLGDGLGGTFHFAYIDADKTGYDDYYERSLALLQPNGLIAIDNVFWSGTVADEHATDADTIALRALNAKIGRDERVDASMLPLGDGLALIRKR
ncbi:MAG TPA: class I SAM-dependent methyltransferase [Candidatus Baltobacteraceae bacterium]|jgi:predicted O-methyltransferase YrrM